MPFQKWLPAGRRMNAWCQGYCAKTPQKNSCQPLTSRECAPLWNVHKCYQWLWRASLADFCEVFDSCVVGEVLLQMNGAQMSRLDRRGSEWLLLLLFSMCDHITRWKTTNGMEKLLLLCYCLSSLLVQLPCTLPTSGPFITTSHFLFSSCHIYSYSCVCVWDTACVGGV